MNASVNNAAPEGYMRDSQGRLVPLEMVKPIDQARDELVRDIVDDALKLQEQIRIFKTLCLDEIQAFVDLSAEEYDTALGGIRGNVSLVSYDGRYRIQRSIADHLTFDERLQVAKQLIDNCIHRWSDGARSEIRVLVQDAFQTDKEGRINTGRVLGLRRLDISDPEWKQAMQAISDSVQVAGSKTYVRLYRRVGNSDQWEQISLDIAAL